MKKDIEIPKMEDISVAVVKEMNEEKTAEVFNVYLINLKKKTIQNTLIMSRGYGKNQQTGEKINTSILRHFIGDLEGRNYTKIEPIMEEVFGLNNEYWVSFFQSGRMFDKKFIFLAETICDENMINVPVIKRKGVLI